MKKSILLLLVAVILLGTAFFIRSQGRDVAGENTTVTPTPSPIVSSPVATLTPSPTTTPTPATTFKRIEASDIAAVPSQYNYSAEIPANWAVEIVSGSEAVNIYDPALSDATNLEKSQIFIRYFSANSFLTLTTVDVLSRESLTIKNRPAVRYEIQKKASVANFASQPTWRNKKHIVTDIRLSDSNPSLFYVIAQRPGLSDAIYQHFLDSIQLP